MSALKLKAILPQLPRIKALVEKATPGPWRFADGWGEGPADAYGSTRTLLASDGPDLVWRFAPDGDFAATARTDVPALVEALEEAKTLLEKASAFDCGHEDAEMCRCPLAQTLSAIREALGQ